MAINRGNMRQQITKGNKMPKGPGTYGSRVGRPKKKGWRYDDEEEKIKDK